MQSARRGWSRGDDDNGKERAGASRLGPRTLAEHWAVGKAFSAPAGLEFGIVSPEFLVTDRLVPL